MDNTRRGMERNYAWPPRYKEDVIDLGSRASPDFSDLYDQGYRVVTWGGKSTAHLIRLHGRIECTYDGRTISYPDLPKRVNKEETVMKTLEEAVIGYLRAGRSIDVNPVFAYFGEVNFFGADSDTQQGLIEGFLTDQADRHHICEGGISRFRLAMGDLLPQPQPKTKEITLIATVPVSYVDSLFLHGVQAAIRNSYKATGSHKAISIALAGE